jgi:hypothetical protein
MTIFERARLQWEPEKTPKRGKTHLHQQRAQVVVCESGHGDGNNQQTQENTKLLLQSHFWSKEGQNDHCSPKKSSSFFSILVCARNLSQKARACDALRLRTALFAGQTDAFKARENQHKKRA